ncbi:nitric oxide reductase activation protein NorD [Grimontia marina]|uniref:von Willebrand factor type A domain protein n=1 Tax=Grimontia marina TaxID=646534 RepID=A0A128EYS3_9GAMM|nr:VWA domain-containing protein [Grimontia marina]CZF79415.1 von Willebrand factor type A domain protein [Grimontia marina]
MRANKRRVEAQLVEKTDGLKLAFETGFQEAEALMNVIDLNEYLTAVLDLFSKYQSDESVSAFLLSVPNIQKQLSDSVTVDVKDTIVILSEWLGSERLSQYLNTLPAVAERLCSKDGLNIYQKLVEELARTAPRCLKVFLTRSPSFLTSLPILGLRHWALIGAKAHANQIDSLHSYFTLASPESQNIFQRQRRGTLFVDTQRQLNFYLRAIWGRDFFLRPRIIEINDAENEENSSPLSAIHSGTILLPDAMEAQDPSNPTLSAKNLYRASVTHAAAHLMFSRPKPHGGFSDIQRYCYGLVEDARVEALAIRDFPGLRQLWMPFHLEQVKKSNDETNQLSLALLSGNAEDAPAHLTYVVNRFNALLSIDNSLEQEVHKDTLARRLASDIDINDEGNLPNQLFYRDDNTYLWFENGDEFYQWPLLSEPQVKRTVNVMEMVNEIDNELADDNAQEVWILESEFFRDGDPENVSMNELEGKQQISSPFHYPEWDYTANQMRPAWVTLTERSVKKSTASKIDELVESRQAQLRKIKAIVEALQPKGLQRLRKQFEGDELDLDAAIDAMKEIRRGALPDMNIDQRLIRRERDLAVLVLLDLSQSTMDSLPGDHGDLRVLDIAQEATVMLAKAIDGIGDPFAIHGFNSNGRSDVRYQRFKDFDEAYDDITKSRLAAMEGGLSTRMGAALRHAKTYLAQQPQRKKLLLMISDGEPADIDSRDPLYLQADTKNAIDDVLMQGITPFCLTIDPEADSYVGQIFGEGHYSVLDDTSRLPEVLPHLFASITRTSS